MNTARFAITLFFVLMLRSGGIVHADGGLPPQPYRYLHPPPSLASNNQKPLSGQYVVPTDYMRASGFTMFTTDGQAGVSGEARTFQVPAHTTAVNLQAQPVEAPPGLPAQVALDGNAYRMSATAQPGNAPLTPIRPVSVILRWPHLPIAIYFYHAGAWHQLCYSNKALLTTSTISCPSSVLGIFAAVTTPSSAAGSSSGPSSSSAPLVSLSRYILLLAAILVVILAAIGAYLVSRSNRTRSPRP